MNSYSRGSITKDFKFIKLSELKLSKPDTLVKVDDPSISYVSESKPALQAISKCYGVGDYILSSKLYNCDIQIWNSLVSKYSNLAKVDEEGFDLYACIVDNQIESVVNNKSIIDNLQNKLDEFVNKNKMTVKYNYYNNCYDFYVTEKFNNSDKEIGFLIKYNIVQNRIKVNSLLIDGDKIFIEYDSTVDMSMDKVKFDLDLDYDILMTESKINADGYSYFTQFLNRNLSYQEFVDYVKGLLGIKLSPTKDPDILLKEKEGSLGKGAIDYIANIVNDLKKSGNWNWLYKSWLMKSSNFYSLNYLSLYTYICKLVSENKTDSDNLVRLIKKLSNHNTNYDALEMGGEVIKSNE